MDVEETSAPASRRWLPILARLGVTLTVLALLVLALPRDQLLAAIDRVSALIWISVVLGIAAGQTAAAFKWRLSLRASGHGGGMLEVLRAHAAGQALNLFLPSIVGGDAVRAGVLGVTQRGGAKIAAAALADRLIDTAALLILASVGALAVSSPLPGWTGRILALTTAGLVVGILFARPILRRVPGVGRPARLASKLNEALEELYRRPGVALVVLSLSLLIQSGFILLNALLGDRVGIAVSLSAWFVAVPLAKLVATLPVSLGGIGVREAALAGIFLSFGTDPTLVVAQGLVWQSAILAMAFLSGTAAFAIGRATADNQVLQ